LTQFIEELLTVLGWLDRTFSGTTRSNLCHCTKPLKSSISGQGRQGLAISSNLS
jgi:hypothetical protein